MAADATLAVRRAILARLKADAGVTALVPAARILPPRRGAVPGWPFIAYSNVIETPFTASCLDGSTIRCRLQAFAKDEAAPVRVGEETATAIGGAIKASLSDAVVQLEGGGTAQVRWLDNVSAPDADEASAWIVTVRFEVTVVRERT